MQKLYSRLFLWGMVCFLFMPMVSVKVYASQGDYPMMYANNLAVKSGSWIYYKGDKTLYRMQSNGSKNQKLGKIGSSDTFLIHGSYIFYTYKNELYRVNTNGKNNKKLSKYSSKLYGMQSNKLYFANALKTKGRYMIYRCNQDGSNREQIGESYYSGEADILDNYFYYINTSSSGKSSELYQMEKDGTNITVVDTGLIHTLKTYKGFLYYNKTTSQIGAESGKGSLVKLNPLTYESESLARDANLIDVVDNYIYYTNNNHVLYRMDIYGQNRILVGVLPSNHIWVRDGYIYYTDTSKEQTILYQMEADGANVRTITTLTNYSNNTLEIIGDWIFYEQLTQNKVILTKKRIS